MDWMSILIGEAISIAVTVLIIDRLFSQRERRRWREARELLVGQADRECRKIIDAWKDWLIAMAKEAHDNKLSEIDEDLLLENGYCTFEDESSMSLLESCLGKPVGIKLGGFARDCDSKRIDEMIKSLVPYLAENLPWLHQGHSSWSRLRQEIDPPVRKLSDMVDRYSTVVDPKLLQTVIRLSGDLDSLESGEYESLVNLLNLGSLSIANTIAEGIRQTLDLKYYIRRNQ